MPLHHPPALQAAPGHRPRPSPVTNSPPDCLCPGSALAQERVRRDAAGQAARKLKTPWRDGTTHLVMSPMEFMQRLAALVPRPRLHLIRLHRVPAPTAKGRALRVPQGPDECEAKCTHHGPKRLSWARLLERVFDLDLEHCPNFSRTGTLC